MGMLAWGWLGTGQVLPVPVAASWVIPWKRRGWRRRKPTTPPQTPRWPTALPPASSLARRHDPDRVRAAPAPGPPGPPHPVAPRAPGVNRTP